MDNLVFTELKLQDYLISEKMTVKQKRNIFLFRVRMADYGENYPNRSILPIPCRMCHLHRDCQAHSVSCQETMNNIRTRGNYNEIFSNSISEDTAIMIEEILETRRKQAEPSWREEKRKQAELCRISIPDSDQFVWVFRQLVLRDEFFMSDVIYCRHG